MPNPHTAHLSPRLRSRKPRASPPTLSSSPPAIVFAAVSSLRNHEPHHSRTHNGHFRVCMLGRRAAVASQAVRSGWMRSRATPRLSFSVSRS